MNRSGKRAAFIFVLAVTAMWVLSSVAVSQDFPRAAGTMIIDVEGLRPLDVALSELRTRHGWAITYEELPLQYSGDTVDVTLRVRKDGVREAKAASALNHPNIITIHDIAAAVPSGSRQAVPVDFIVMECVEGRSLDQLIAAGHLPVEEVLGYAVQIAAGLGPAHAAGIVHRDIKPANIMVTPTGAGGGHGGHITILDFGLAKLSEREADPDAPTQAAGTRTGRGAILGTVAYMSPEQAEGKVVDARTDIFSFGCVLYEMLARQRPFQGTSNLSILTAILHQQPKPLKQLRPDVPGQTPGDPLAHPREGPRPPLRLGGRTSERPDGLPVAIDGHRPDVASAEAAGCGSRSVAAGGRSGGGHLASRSGATASAGPANRLCRKLHA